MVVHKELFPGVQVNTEYFEEEQKVNELKKEVAELDIVLLNEQLKELEVWKLQSLSLCYAYKTMIHVGKTKLLLMLLSAI